MLKELEFEVTFKSPARTIKFKHSFLPGLTVITGKNGSGKSLITEMAQYALHGTKALRGSADSYKSISVTQSFEIRGVEYTIIRNPKVCQLLQGTTPVAAGTKPVNAAVAALFGYSYDVFKVANACNQDKINELGDMLPTARKKLIDDTIGLSALEGLGKFIAKSESDLRSEVKGMQSVLVEPVAPLLPLDYKDSHTIQNDLLAYRLIDSEFNALTAKANRVIAEVSDLVACQDEDQLEVYKGQVAAYKVQVAEHNLMVTQLNTLKNLYTAIPVAGDLTLEQVETIELNIKEYVEWEAKNNLRTRLATSTVQHSCPKCDHVWHDKDPRLVELESLPISLVRPGHTQAQLNTQRIALARQVERDSLQKHHTELEEKLKTAPQPVAGAEANVCRIEAYKISKARHEQQVLQAQAQLKERQDAILALQDPKFQDLGGRISRLASALTEALVYERQRVTYAQAKTLYDNAKLKVEKLESEAEEWNRAKSAVTDLRARVKGFLLPSLNKVASLLINQMTGGALSWVIINDDFEITVEGQSLETLSGAGKSVANLAIRIGLGQVLTNGVFSALWLDEIDASCDAERSTYIAECLRRLTGQIKQIVQISHKPLEADNYVRL